MKSLDDVLDLAGKMKAANPQIRYGQSLYNALFDLFPDISKKLVGNHMDPFFFDSNIPAFLEHVALEIEKDPTESPIEF